MVKKLYRVVVKTTNSVQPSGTFWLTAVIYCGYDRDEARRVFHESRPADYWYGYGSRARETVCQSAVCV